MNHRLIAAWAVLLCVVCVTQVSAGCVPGKFFGTFDFTQDKYFYLDLGNETGDNSNQIGRFWQPTARAGANEGTYDASLWLKEYYFGSGSWYLYGNTGIAGTVGCPSIEMVVAVEDLIESPAGLQAVLSVGRIDETFNTFNHFDFTRLERDWTSLQLPPVNVIQQAVVGPEVRLDFSLPSLEPAWNALDGVPSTETLLAYQIRRAVVDVGGAAPGPQVEA